MDKYYTKPCNFHFGTTSQKNIGKKTIPLNGQHLISFDKIFFDDFPSDGKLNNLRFLSEFFFVVIAFFF